MLSSGGEGGWHLWGRDATRWDQGDPVYPLHND